MHPHIAFLPSFVCLIGLTLPAAGGPPRTDRYSDPLPDGAVYRIGTTRLRHEIGVMPAFENVLLNRDGKFVFSSQNRDVVRMWETATGREVRQFHCPNGRFSLSVDGSLLAIDHNHQLHLYDAATGKKRRTMNLCNWYDPNPSDNISAGGKILTAFRTKGQPQTNHIIRYEIATSKELGDWPIELGAWPIDKDEPLALSGDARLAASLGPDEQTIRLWETANGKKIREWKLPQTVPLNELRLIFSPDSRHVAAAGKDAMIRVYETDTGKEVRGWKVPKRRQNSERTYTIYSSADVARLAFAPDGKTLASVDPSSKVLSLWDWKTGRELRHIETVSGPVAFSRDGKVIAAGGADGRLRLWETATGRDLCPFPDPGAIFSLDFSPDGRTLAVQTDEPQVRMLDSVTGRLLKRYPDYRSIDFSPDGESLLVQRRDRSYCLLDAGVQKGRIRFDGYLIGWNPGKKPLATFDNDSVHVHVWDLVTGKKLRDFGVPKEKDHFVMAIAAFSNAPTVALMDEKAALIHLFSTDTGKELRQWKNINQRMNYQAQRGSSGISSRGAFFFPNFSPNGKMLLAGIDEKSFGLWDVSTGEWSLRLSCGNLLPHKPIFSPNGDLLCLLDTHGDPCVVDAETGRVRQRLQWKGGELSWILNSVRKFSADGRLLAAAYDPHTLILWEVATGRPIHIWPGHGRGALRQMIFSADNRRLATIGTDGTALVWDVTSQSPDGQLPARKLTPAETKQAWKDLGDTDAAKAHRAIWSLVADPMRAMPLLREQLHPAPAVDPHRLARWIADLDSNEFAVRETATRELRKMGELAQPALRAAIKDKPSLELRRRVQGLLEEMDSCDLPVESRRGLRAVAVLEHIASADARKLLRELAAGAAGARLTEQAKSSVARLRLRRIQP